MSTELYAIVGTGVAIIGLGRHVTQGIKSDMRDMEKRIRGDADQAHKAIGENINLVRQDIRDLRGDVKELNTRVSRIEGKIGLPSASAGESDA